MEVVEYKHKIMHILNSSKEIVELVDGQWNDGEPAALEYKSFFPYKHSLETMEDEKTFVSFDLKVQPNDNKKYNNVTVMFFISSNTSCVHTAEGLRTDRIAAKLEKIFNHKNVLGIGKGELLSSQPYYPSPIFCGRLLQYQILDFNRGMS